MKEFHLDLGEPTYAPPAQALAAAAAAIQSERMGYTHPQGLPALRAAIQADLSRRRSILAAPEQIVVTAGASMGLFASLAAVARAGDEILVPDPGYPAYLQSARILGLVPRPYTLTSSHRFVDDLNSLANSITERTRVIIWNSPSNPLGTLAPAELTSALVALAHERNCYLLSDEVYDSLVLRGKHTSPTAFDDGTRVFAVFSFSKTYALTGWRIGYVVPPPEFANSVTRAHWAAAMSPSTVGQLAAAACLQAPDAYRIAALDQLGNNRDQVLAMLQECELPAHCPSAGMFIWACIRPVTLDDCVFVQALWEQEHVAVMPGSVFGKEGQGYIRISFAADIAEVREGVSRLANFWRRAVIAGFPTPLPRQSEK